METTNEMLPSFSESTSYVASALYSVSAADLHKTELKIKRRIQKQRYGWFSSAYRKLIVKTNGTHRSGYLSILSIGPWECAHWWSPRCCWWRWFWLWAKPKMACMKLKKKRVFRFWARHIFHWYFIQFQSLPKTHSNLNIPADQMTWFEFLSNNFLTFGVVVQFFKPRKNNPSVYRSAAESKLQRKKHTAEWMVPSRAAKKRIENQPLLNENLEMKKKTRNPEQPCGETKCSTRDSINAHAGK